MLSTPTKYYEKTINMIKTRHTTRGIHERIPISEKVDFTWNVFLNRRQQNSIDADMILAWPEVKDMKASLKVPCSS